MPSTLPRGPATTEASPPAGAAVSGPAIKSLPKSSIHFEGGDGATKEHAIKIMGASGENDGVAAEYQYLNALYGDGKWHPGSQSLITVDGKNVDQLEITNPKGKSEQFFFDISEFFGKF